MVFVVSDSHIDEITGNSHSWFFFVRAFEVPNVGKLDPCSVRHKEYCGNFLQKFQPLLQFSAIAVICTSKLRQRFEATKCV
jgi:hypothetical protein